MDSTTQGIALLVLLIVFLANAVIRRREKPVQRPIGAFDYVPEMTSQSIETGRPLHLSLGSATIGSETTLLTIVGAEYLYYLTREVTINDTPPIVTVSDTATIPFAMDVLRRAYVDKENPAGYNPFGARWYPAGSRSLAFAAALSAMQGDDQIGANMLVGRYGVELALVLDTSNRRNLPSVAVSDQLEGQAIAYAMAQEPLIGEEIFAAAGYLSKQLKWAKRNLVIDLLRWVLIAGIIALFIVELVNGS